MIRFVFTFIILLSFLLANSQSLSFVKSFGSNSETTGYTLEEILDLDRDLEGNIYCVGNFRNELIDSDGSVLLSSPSNEESNTGFLLKLDPDGNVIWARRVGNKFPETGWSSCVSVEVLDCTIYIAGNFVGEGLFGEISLPNVGGETPYLAKFDTDGNCEWARGWQGGSGYNSMADVASDSEGNLYLAGGYKFSLELDDGTTLTPDYGVAENGFLIKVNADGEEQWGLNIPQRFNGATTNRLTIDNKDNLYVGTYYISAYTDAYLQNFSINLPEITEFETGALILKFDSDGILLNHKAFKHFNVNQITYSSETDELYFMSQYWGPDNLLQGSDWSFLNIIGEGSQNEIGRYAVIKLNTELDPIWGNLYKAFLRGIETDDQGNVYTFGTTSRNYVEFGSGISITNNSNTQQIVYTKLNNDGICEWANTIEASNSDIPGNNATAAHVLGEDNLYIGGAYHGILNLDEGNPLSPAVGTPSHLFLSGFGPLGLTGNNCSPVSTTESLSPVTIELFPNPSNGIVNIQLEEETTSFELFTISGVRVSTEQFLYDGTTLDISLLYNGIYIAKFKLRNNEHVYKNIVKY